MTQQDPYLEGIAAKKPSTNIGYDDYGGKVNAPNNFSFSVALERLKNGEKVTRKKWEPDHTRVTPMKPMWVYLDNGAIRITNGSWSPGTWKFDMADILADDWEIVHESSAAHNKTDA